MPCTPKKTVKQIIDSGNDFVIAVKKNQPTLYQFLETQFEQPVLESLDVQNERIRGRVTQRTVRVLSDVTGLDPGWIGVQGLIRVERTGTRGSNPYAETRFHISSLRADATEFSARVRGHWQIENGLHWSKDWVTRILPPYVQAMPLPISLLSARWR